MPPCPCSLPQGSALAAAAASGEGEGGGAPPAAPSADHAAQLLQVIAAAAAEFPPDQAGQLANQLLRTLRGFTLPPAAAAAHVAAVAQLTAGQGGGRGAGAWVPELLSGAEKVGPLGLRGRFGEMNEIERVNFECVQRRS